MHRTSLGRVPTIIFVMLAAAVAWCQPQSASAANLEFATPPSITLSTLQAGGHPDLTTAFDLTLDADQFPTGSLKDVVVDLPAGLVGNPNAIPRCTLDQLHQGACPASAKIGTMQTVFRFPGGGSFAFPSDIWNMVPRRGTPAEFVTVVLGMDQYFEVGLRTGADYGIRTSLTKLQALFPVGGATVTFWGVPADHNGGGTGRVPFLTNPADCTSNAAARMRVTSWQEPADPATDEIPLGPMTGCDKLPPLDVGLSAAPTSGAAGQPAGYDVGLTVKQVAAPDAPATPSVKDVRITLPEGTAISPSGADGLLACSDDEVGLQDAADPACPDRSRVGSVRIVTPLLDDPLEGSVYIGTPRPGDRFRLLLVAQGSGITIKLAGSARPDPVTGQVITDFRDNPALPFTELQVHLDGGPRAVLANPPSCGIKTASATLTPYGGGAAATASNTFSIDSGSGDGCPNARAFSPVLDGGTVTATAGADSPFIFRLTRSDADREIGTIGTELPPGLLGDVRTVPLCADAAAATGTCPAATLIGRSRVASGAGAAPFWLEGKVYLTGPYKGAPFGLSIVVPALAGPYDLGTVVVRASVAVDRHDAHLSVVSDPLPTILEGVPLRLRDIVLELDRPGFMFNPTSCEERQIAGRITAVDGTVASVSRRFQATGCGALGFRPRLAMSLDARAPSGDAQHPKVIADVTPRPGDANLRNVDVRLPDDLGVDIRNTGSLCTAAQDAAHDCPASSIIGKASAETILHEPLRGPVYFVENRSTDPVTGRIKAGLPKLYVALHGDGVSIDLHASTNLESGRIRTTFADIPDVRLTAFHLEINGGPRGILQVSGAGGVCARDQVVESRFEGQNGKVRNRRALAGTSCPVQVLARGWSSKTVWLRLGGLAAGRLTVRSSGLLRPASRTVSGSATIGLLSARMTANALRILHRRGTVRIPLTVALRPAHGGALKLVRTAVVVRRTPKRLPSLLPAGTFR